MPDEQSHSEMHNRTELSLSTMLPISDSVMPGLVPGIHVALSLPNDVDGRDTPGHDDAEMDRHTTPIFKAATLDGGGAKRRLEP
ncbi:hypothetical protein ACQR07_25025 [Bradyrhizobium sp. HKCCYLS20291]